MTHDNMADHNCADAGICLPRKHPTGQCGHMLAHTEGARPREDTCTGHAL